MSKRLTYHGKRFVIPDGYNYICADNNGRVWAYVEEPVWNVLRGEWHDNGAGTMKEIGWLPSCRYEFRAINK
jgi:hypothetical protein